MNMKLQKNMLAKNALSGARPSKLDQGAIKGLSSKTKEENKDTNIRQSINGANEDLTIENDRLKTTIMIMSQKLKLKQEDRQEEDEAFIQQINQLKETLQKKDDESEELRMQNKDSKKKVQELTDKINDLEAGGSKASKQEKKLRDLNRGLEFQVEELSEQLETADEQRKKAKQDIHEANDKIVSLE